MNTSAADVDGRIATQGHPASATWQPVFSRAARWTTRGVWAVLDQALFAVSGLVVHIMLARWLPAAEYGAFVTAQTVLLMIGMLHTSFLTEPLLIFGAAKYRPGFSQYLRLLMRYHWHLTVAVSVVLLAAAMALDLLGLGLLAKSLVGVSVATPLVLFSWLGRRACYAVSQPRSSALAGALNLALVIAGATMLAETGTLSVLSAQLLLGGVALVSAASMMPALLRLTSSRLAPPDLSTVWSDHWLYARWSGAAGALAWIQAYLYYFMLPLSGGLAATASFRALINLVLPILQSDSALITLLAPVFVRTRPDADRFRRLIRWCLGAFSAEALLYWVVLALAGERILEWVYGGVYRYDRQVLLLLGLLPLVNSWLNVLGTALRAREEVDALVWASVTSVLVTVTGGAAAVAATGVEGAVFGTVLAAAVQALAMAVLMRRRHALVDTA